jgi:hypothetical protein
VTLRRSFGGEEGYGGVAGLTLVPFHLKAILSNYGSDATKGIAVLNRKIEHL